MIQSRKSKKKHRSKVDEVFLRKRVGRRSFSQMALLGAGTAAAATKAVMAAVAAAATAAVKASSGRRGRHSRDQKL